MIRSPLSLLATTLLASVVAGADPLVVGHRGLPTHAPEEPHATFAACIELRVGI